MRFFTLCSFALVAVAASACGGKVIFGEGSGGSGGTTSTTGGVTTGKTSSTVVSGTSTGNVVASSSTGIDPGICAKFCAVVGNCTSSPCDQTCQQILATPGCQSEAIALLTCITQSFDPMTCSPFPGACQMEAQVFQSCSQPPPQQCQNQSCNGNGQACACQGQCFGSPVSTKCTLLPSPMCQCFANGQFVGQCTQPSGNACDLSMGCCSQFFFPQPGG